MHQMREALRRPLAVAAILGALTMLVVGGCGGSSGSSSTAAHAKTAAALKALRARHAESVPHNGAVAKAPAPTNRGLARPRTPLARRSKAAALAASGRFRQALGVFASCLRKNGIDMPAPNTSGRGPLFSTKGIDTSSARFRAATARCRPVLARAFGVSRAHPGARAQPTG